MGDVLGNLRDIHEFNSSMKFIYPFFGLLNDGIKVSTNGFSHSF